MSIKTLKCYVYMEYEFDMNDFEKRWQPNIRNWKAPESEERVFLHEVDVSVNVPKDFDGSAMAVLSLRKEREKVVEKFTQELKAIDDKIANLQAITYEG